jgi:hypothetical protein
MRAELLALQQLREETITLPQLRRAVREGRRVCCMNSVRGVYDVNVLFGPPEKQQATIYDCSKPVRHFASGGWRDCSEVARPA